MFVSLLDIYRIVRREKTAAHSLDNWLEIQVRTTKLFD